MILRFGFNGSYTLEINGVSRSAKVLLVAHQEREDGTDICIWFDDWNLTDAPTTRKFQIFATGQVPNGIHVGSVLALDNFHVFHVYEV